MKKIIAIVLSLLLTMSLCACAGSNDPGSSTPGESTPGESTPGESTPDGGKDDNLVSAYLIKEILLSSNYEGETSSMKAILEYDEDYNIVGSKTYSDNVLQLDITYDKDMNKPLVQVEYDEAGEKSGHWEYTYDDNGNELTSCKYDENGTIKWRYVKTYDANNNLLTDETYEGTELQNQYRYVYNAAGKVEIRYAHWQGSDEESWTKYAYDEHGNVTDERSGYGNEEYNVTTYENAYENGKLAEVRIYSTDGELYDLTRYDADGNTILSVSYFEGEENYRTEFTYENGKLITEVSYNGGEESYRQTNTYTEAGLLLERTIVHDSTETSRQVYTYNDHDLPTTFKAYIDDVLYGDATVSYETIRVSKETANRIEDLFRTMDLF